MKKETLINRKQHKSTIDSNINQHDNAFGRRQRAMRHPVVLDVLNAWSFILPHAALGGDKTALLYVFGYFVVPFLEWSEEPYSGFHFKRMWEDFISPMLVGGMGYIKENDGAFAHEACFSNRRSRLRTAAMRLIWTKERKMRIMSNDFSRKNLKRQGFCRFSFYNREWKEKWPGSMSFQVKKAKNVKRWSRKSLVVFCRQLFLKKLF